MDSFIKDNRSESLLPVTNICNQVDVLYLISSFWINEDSGFVILVPLNAVLFQYWNIENDFNTDFQTWEMARPFTEYLFSYICCFAGCG